MEHPKEPYHVRPDPQQPKRGGKAMITALKDLEDVLSEKDLNLDRLKEIQKKIHETANHYNDDRLVDMLRQLSEGIDTLYTKPEHQALQLILQQLLKIKVELKHL